MNRKLTDQAILETAVALRATAPVTGRRLRRALAERYGARGDVARVYRLLQLVQPGTGEVSGSSRHAQATEQRAALAAMAERLAVAERERLAAMAAAEQASERARLAEHREQAHQDKWAVEVDRLRNELRAGRLNTGTFVSPVEHERVRRLLAVAERRAAELERQLWAVQPPTDRHPRDLPA